jgi:hypothetical protein
MMTFLCFVSLFLTMTFFDAMEQAGIVGRSEKVRKAQGTPQITKYLIKFSPDQRLCGQVAHWRNSALIDIRTHSDEAFRSHKAKFVEYDRHRRREFAEELRGLRKTWDPM